MEYFTNVLMHSAIQLIPVDTWRRMCTVRVSWKLGPWVRIPRGVRVFAEFGEYPCNKKKYWAPQNSKGDTFISATESHASDAAVTLYIVLCNLGCKTFEFQELSAVLSFRCLSQSLHANTRILSWNIQRPTTSKSLVTHLLKWFSSS
jgi:hypothetical protein